MRWPGIEALYGSTLRQSPVFAVESKLGVKTGSKAEGKETEKVENPGDARWEELHKRVIEHVRKSVLKEPELMNGGQNIRVIAAYYSRISMSRLTELLDLPPITTERTLCKLVTDKTVYARIDRPAGIVSFKQKRSINEVLNLWSGDIGKMLSLVEKTSHLVSKVSRALRPC